ncbi:hypothetical protein C8R44DRAFT_696702 [Mycena epipterygia]|nr:hypothetical protein C8R44DRAFT_696702 [Mycena epipterygia]
MEDVLPTKRRRTDDADTSETPVMRSTEYWFDDGNVILEVESTQFRLTKSMLSMHSTVFRDMFMMPLPADEPTVQDCPVVPLSGDATQDWIHLLGAMYPKCLSEGLPRMEVVAAILRLGQKYDFPVFRKDCLRRLKVEFPTTLLDFEVKLEDGWTLIEEEGDMLFPLLSLAREIDLHSILPSAYYQIITDSYYMSRVLDDKDADLNVNDRLACLQGYAKLLGLQSTTVMQWLDSDNSHIPCHDCRHDDDCEDALKGIIQGMYVLGRPEIMAFDDWHKNWDADLCTHCRKRAKHIFKVGRKTCWSKLPSAFGLPDWEELKSLDFE